MKPKVAIACQGGGSQTAFTAGVFKALSENKVRDHFDIVSISGTSGGAICGFMLWYAIKRGETPICKRVLDFWNDNAAKTYQERVLNDSIIHSLYLGGKGLIPQFNLSPSSPWVKNSFSVATLGIRNEFTDLGALLASHVDARELASLGRQPEPPILVIGACNVLTGRLHKFSSYLEPVKIEHLLASACVPSIFPAVSIGDMAFWDGLFSDNPPIATLIDPRFVGPRNMPNEIWVIKINPTTADEIPVAPDDILDRHNELTGNISLFHSLRQIERINDFIITGAFNDEFLAEFDIKDPIKIPRSFPDDPDAPYHIPRIEMSVELAKSLDYESKLDRCPEHIARLIRDGEEQGRRFLESRLS
ncbi:patatin [Methylocaldum marinum]|uniref:Patatin n=1 Tax=Methylocaldum marinum TaxID=1432792 RepID=A0A250L0E0_9GAMM|nr:patatin-like phospholipase family protein [Methylocaldum marinum]BBA37327.1 patatin [Methylocaldum marinum]